MFDGENGIALHAMQGNWASSRGMGEVSWFFFELRWELGVHSRVKAGMAIQTRVCSAMSRHLSSYERHLRNIYEAWQGNTHAS